MLPLLAALAIFLAAGFGATAWLRRSATHQAGAGRKRDAQLLADLRWRDFTKLVLQAMHARGYKPVTEQGVPADGIPTDGSDILLQRGEERTLLLCKYGSASVVGPQALLGLSKAAQLRGANGVIVVSPGRFEVEAERLAAQQNIELIDGEDLWPEVRPYVAQPAEPVPPPRARDASRTGAIAWLAAAVLGAGTWFLLHEPAEPAGPDARQVAAPLASQGASALPAIDSAPAPAAASGQSAAASVRTLPDTDSDEARRREVANAISTLFGVSRAVWSTQSTLLVYLSSEDADPSGELCPLLERFPDLAASRVQLQPPPGSNKPVRFKQCRAY